LVRARKNAVSAQKQIRVLLVEDNPGDAALIKRALLSSEISCVVDVVEWLSNSIMAATNRRYDIVLLDLSLPDSHGVDTLVTFMKRVSGVPVIVMTGNNDMRSAIQCVQAGAQDYLLKDDAGPKVLPRSIMYAMERHRVNAVRASLMHQSINAIVRPKTPSAGYRSLSDVSDVFDDIVRYLRKNAPEAAQDVEDIIQHSQALVVLRLSSEMMDHEAIEDIVLEARDEPQPSARAMVLDAIEKMSR